MRGQKNERRWKGLNERSSSGDLVKRKEKDAGAQGMCSCIWGEKAAPRLRTKAPFLSVRVKSFNRSKLTIRQNKENFGCWVKYRKSDLWASEREVYSTQLCVSCLYQSHGQEALALGFQAR